MLPCLYQQTPFLSMKLQRKKQEGFHCNFHTGYSAIHQMPADYNDVVPIRVSVSLSANTFTGVSDSYYATIQKVMAFWQKRTEFQCNSTQLIISLLLSH
jgi:hypothetical protein